MTGSMERKPRLAGWEITRQCNLACPHCFSAAARRPHNEFTTAAGRDLIDVMARIGVETIGWTGGEPLLREDLEELTAYAADKGIRSSITTNGILLDKERVRTLQEAGIFAIQISLDGSTPAWNHKIRGATEEEYHKIIDAVHYCREAAMPMYLAVLIGQENIDDVYDIIKLAKREGLKEVRFCGYTPAGRGKDEHVKERLSFSSRLGDLAELIETVQVDTALKYFFDPGFGPVPPFYNFHPCVAGMETFYLKSNGDVFPCTSLLYKQFLIGNVHKRSLEEIWNDPAMYAMAQYSRDKLNGLCGSCDNFDRCAGACRGAVFSHTGDLNGSFPPCLYQLTKKAGI